MSNCKNCGLEIEQDSVGAWRTVDSRRYACASMQVEHTEDKGWVQPNAKAH